MRSTRLSIVPFLVAAACASRPRPATTTVEPTPVEIPRAAARTVLHAPTTPALARLARTVDDLALGLEDPSHEAVATSLEALADAVDELPDERGGQIRDLARELGSSGDRQHIDLVVSALRLAVAATLDHVADTSDANAKVALVNASSVVEGLVASKPLLSQTSEILAAFRSVTTALFAVHGAEHERYATKYEFPKRGLEEMHSWLAATEKAISSVASATNWEDARLASASALDDLAMVVATVPASGPRAQTLLTAGAISIRYDAALLREVNAIDFRKTTWIRRSLLVAVNALDGVTANPLADKLLERARVAAAAISPRSSLVFQRAAVQDALRSTVTACLALEYAMTSTAK